jgi:hypothetical protein
VIGSAPRWLFDRCHFDLIVHRNALKNNTFSAHRAHVNQSSEVHYPYAPVPTISRFIP